jgi:integrase
MAKTVKDKTLDSATARSKLAPSGVPYWRNLDKGLHLGYRKGKTGGVWVLRRYLGAGSYRVENIGTADDHGNADGHTIFDFYQAQRKAREVAAKAAAPTGVAGFTVAKAMAAYRAQPNHKDDLPTKGRIEKLILPKLGNELVAELTKMKLNEWFKDLVPPIDDEDEDDTRRRKASANRVLAILRAALNLAFQDEENKITSDVAWRILKPFANTDAPIERFLSDDECRRLVNAAQGSFRDLVRAALFTACRYGDLRKMRVSDFDPENKMILVRKPKSRKWRHVNLNDEAVEFFSVLAAGKPRTAYLLIKDDGQPWGEGDQSRLMKYACKAASIDPPIGIHILRHTVASRMLKAGVPMSVIASHLGHANTRMTEKHYAHLAPSHVAEVVRGMAPLGIGEETNIVTIAKRGK